MAVDIQKDEKYCFLVFLYGCVAFVVYNPVIQSNTQTVEVDNTIHHIIWRFSIVVTFCKKLCELIQDYDNQGYICFVLQRHRSLYNLDKFVNFLKINLAIPIVSIKKIISKMHVTDIAKLLILQLHCHNFQFIILLNLPDILWVTQLLLYRYEQTALVENINSMDIIFQLQLSYY